MKHLFNNISKEEKQRILEMHGVKRILKETEQDQQMVAALSKENLELASAGIPPIDMETIERFENDEDTSDEQYQISVVEPGQNYSKLPSLASQMGNAICNASKDDLKQAKSQILNLFRRKKQKNVSEQVGLITILGITASPVLFLAIGGFLLILIIARLVRWLRNRDTDGMGCKGRESWNHLIKRINSGY